MYEPPRVERLGTFRELTLGGKKDLGSDLAQDVANLCERSANTGSSTNHARCIS